MKRYDKEKLSKIMDHQRELSAAYRAVSEDVRFYMDQYRQLLKKMEQVARKTSFKRPAGGGRPYIDSDFTPLHEMKADEAFFKYKDHPSKDNVSIEVVRAFFSAQYESTRSRSHQQNISERSKENLIVIQSCMDFLEEKGVPKYNIPEV